MTMSFGNAIASNPFPSDPLYHAGDASGIRILSKATGAASAMLAAITFPSSVSGLSPFINSMDNDPFNNVVYVSFQDSAGDYYIATINLSTGAVTFLSDDEQKAPSLLNTLTVNRRYEECDYRSDNTPPLPLGTSCTHECLVIEHDCSDGIDNDQNGLTDCMDPACNDQPCNNHDGCQINDTCVNGACVGTDFNPCVDLIANECVVTECHPTPGDDSDFYCTVVLDTSKTLFGSCTPDAACGARNDDGTCSDIESTCLAGQCVQEEICPVDEVSPIITCEGQTRSTIPVGICSGGPDNGDVCTDLIDSTDCGEGGTCVAQGTEDQPGCLDDNQCTADSCIEGIGCEYQALVGVLCSNDNACVVSICDITEGIPTCTDTANFYGDDTVCDTGNPCTTGLCSGAAPGVCNATNVADTTSCTDPSLPCNSAAGSCVAGVCIGADRYSTCTTNDECPLSGACICGDSLTVAPPGGVCGSAGHCACADNPCGACIDGGPANNSTCEPAPTGAQCLENGCNLGTCTNDSLCQGTATHVEFCPGCDDNNACAEPLCTDIGCESTLIQGALPCSVLIPGTDANTGLCDGTISCDLGLTDGTCLGGTSPGLPCRGDADCSDGNTCQFPGTCTAPASSAGQQCFAATDCAPSEGVCQQLTCLGGTNNGHSCATDTDCAGGGLCVRGCVELQPPSCTPVTH